MGGRLGLQRGSLTGQAGGSNYATEADPVWYSIEVASLSF